MIDMGICGIVYADALITVNEYIAYAGCAFGDIYKEAAVTRVVTPGGHIVQRTDILAPVIEEPAVHVAHASMMEQFIP